MLPNQPSIKVGYLPIMTKYGVINTPQIFVSISHKSIYSIIFYALIDSGADVNLFPASIGEMVGIDIKKGEKINMQGVGGSKVVTFKHKINLHIFDKKYKTEVYFSYEQQDPLLGRNGFFNLFKKVSFKEVKRKVILYI